MADAYKLKALHIVRLAKHNNHNKSRKMKKKKKTKNFNIKQSRYFSNANRRTIKAIFFTFKVNFVY